MEKGVKLGPLFNVTFPDFSKLFHCFKAIYRNQTTVESSKPGTIKNVFSLTNLYIYIYIYIHINTYILFEVKKFHLPSFNPFHATVSFYAPWKHQKTSNFLMFSEGRERSRGMKWINNLCDAIKSKLRQKESNLYTIFQSW